MKPGQIIETAIWMNGEETEAEIKKWKEVDLPSLFEIASYENNIKLGDIWFETKSVDDERTPPVPDHVSGDDVKLLVGCAKVLAYKKRAEVKSFIDDIIYEDLELLRNITRRVHRRQRSESEEDLSDGYCDQLIEELGEEAAIRVIDEAVKGFN